MALCQSEIARRSLAIKRLNDALSVAKRALTDVINMPRFKVHLDRLPDILNSFDETHVKIISSLTEEAEIAEAEKIRENFDEVYHSILEIERMICDNAKTPTHESKRESNSLTASSSHRSSVRMPRIVIPIFEGGYKLWMTFYDLYRTLIHENSDLSKIEKFQYLISSLKGEPLNVIKAFPISDLYYEKAYEALVNRYQNKRQLAFSAWQGITSCKLPTNASAQSFRSLLDTFQENLAILKSLDLPVEQWDFIIFHTLLTKLNTNVRQDFEMTVASQEIPKYAVLEKYLETYCKALEHSDPFPSVSRGSAPAPPSRGERSNGPRRPSVSKPTTLVAGSAPTAGAAPPCQYCSGVHFITHCPGFQQLSIQQREQFITDKKLCFNCLRVGHVVSKCTSKNTCRVCSKRHNSLLHNAPSQPVAPSSGSAQSGQLINTAFGVHALSSDASKTVLLSTASSQIMDKWNSFQLCRLLLDSGSQANYITESLVRRLGLQISFNAPAVFGLGNLSTPVLGTVQCTIRPVDGAENKLISFEAIVIKKICDKMPSVKLDSSFTNRLGFVKPADPCFSLPGPVDVLLGPELFHEIFLPGLIPGDSSSPIGMNTIFGWVFMGPSRCLDVTSSSLSHLSVVQTLHTSFNGDLNDDLKRLWELEDLPKIEQCLSPDEQVSEELFRSTYKRDPQTGKFIVELLFKSVPIFLNMHSIAVRRFLKLEARLTKDPTLYEMYKEFMRDYLDSGHMTEIDFDDKDSSECYYIPHHCVLSPHAKTTKLRVVFDASARDGAGLSLNDTQYTGPKLQADLCAILVHFRMHNVVFLSDIRQMYRNILVAEKNRDFQRIVWRFDPDEPLKNYRLNTVTYGVSSSPFLAIRTLHELAITDGKEHKAAAEVLMRDTYVDDVTTGASTVEEALELQRQLLNLLAKAGFELRKWATNKPQLLEAIPEEHCVTKPSSFDADSLAVVKTLGLNWDSVSDQFIYKVDSSHVACTKRNILSQLARVFDPLGLLSPVTFMAKVMIQRLWLLGLDWDQEPPNELKELWQQFSVQLSELSTLSIPRQITSPSPVSCQLHGFCDASLSGYGAAVYLRVEDECGTVTSNLVCAKARVAPTKRVTLPRLELCAAVLLAQLCEFLIPIISPFINLQAIYAWSDSTITLFWISSHPSKWKVFVGNRVAKIQHKLPSACWNYISTKNNPADAASRGLLPSEINSHPLWWNGPSFLLQPSDQWPSSSLPLPITVTSELQAEERATLVTVTTAESDPIQKLLLRFSSLKKILRVVATVRRFCNLLRNRPSSRGPISQQELDESLTSLVKYCQNSNFQSEIQAIKNNKRLPKSFQKLSPFLSDDQILRVGGRLRNSNLDYESKHPAILPSNHRLSALIIDDVHEKSLHAGPQMVQFLVAQNFWVLSARRTIKKRLSRCVPCFRVKPVSSQPLMGDLPRVRVTSVKAFQRVACDFAGPFQAILGRRRRGCRSEKIYLCLFVCLSTKAVHLELCCDLSTESFIAALRRLVSRRGRCNLLLSDNGTNFVGAANQLSSLMQSAAESESIEFKTVPPASPHFNGISEAGVRSVKSHLNRVVGNNLLTFEEFHTLITQVEAVLNSRPLCAISNDPNDYSVLTPGHFLTLAPLTVVPSHDDTHRSPSLLARWQLVQRLHADFWDRWHRDYLNTLNQRSKWTENCRPLQVDDLVVVQDDKSKPLHWPIGRVTAVHPGKDGVIRVATVRINVTEPNGTKLKDFKRPVVKLSLLPVDIDTE